jgi:hypothetical protein
VQVEMKQSVVNGIVALFTPKQLSHVVKILNAFINTRKFSLRT